MFNPFFLFASYSFLFSFFQFNITNKTRKVKGLNFHHVCTTCHRLLQAKDACTKYTCTIQRLMSNLLNLQLNSDCLNSQFLGAVRDFSSRGCSNCSITASTVASMSFVDSRLPMIYCRFSFLRISKKKTRCFFRIVMVNVSVPVQNIFFEKPK